MPNAQFTEGPLDAEIVFVGEAPGAHEAARGGAFIGPAGDLLTECLASAGMPRPKCRLENVFQFHPPGDDLSQHISFNRSGNGITDQVYEEHKAHLKERLEQTSANIIVPLGNIAMYTLTGLHGVTKYRGSIVESTLLPGRKCMPTIHPSAALRYGQKAKFLEGQRKKGIDPYVYRYWIINDIKRALDNTKYPEIRLLDRILRVEPTFTEAEEYLKRARSNPVVAFDIEATRGVNSEVTHIAIATAPDDAMCIPFTSGSNEYWPPDQEAAIWLLVAEILEDPNVVKVAQNSIFDVSFLHRRKGIVTAPIEDTMVATAILFPDFPAGLDFLVSLYCDGEPYYKEDGKQWMRNPFGSDRIFREYNAKDAAVLLEIFPQQREELIRVANYETYKRQRRLIYPLTHAANRGTKIDLSQLGELKKQCEQDIADLEKQWTAECLPYEVNPQSAPQVMNFFYVTLGHRAYTNKGKVTCDVKALQRMAGQSWQGRDAARILLEYRKVVKLKGTYYDMEFDDDSRLRCAYNPVGTSQGRISSSKNIFGTGGNQQNQPPVMQKLMVADQGNILINQDLGQAENRVVAYVFGEPQMINAFEKGIDIHAQTAAMIYGIPMDRVTDEQRDWGKRANHGLNYDLGYKSFSMYYQIAESDAKFIVERYHSIYPGVREGHAAIRDELSRNRRTLLNCFGRRRIFLGRWGDELFKLAYSYIPQSTVGEKLNSDGVVFLYENQHIFPKCEILNTIHDSIRYQIPLTIGTQQIVANIKALKENLESSITWRGQSFRIPVDTEIGFSFDKTKMLKWKANYINTTPVKNLAEELDCYVREAT